jgi:hypothetical protein
MRRSFLLAPILFAALARAADPDPGPPIPVTPGNEPIVVKKIRVTDCRAVRGFTGAPVDGTLESGSWDGKVWEYPMPEAGAGVGYDYLNHDGLHLTLADADGFNAVVVRGGIKATLLRDVKQYDDPKSGQPLHEFPGGKLPTTRAWFDAPVKTDKLSFFNVSDGVIGDVAFFRVTKDAGALKADVAPLPAKTILPEIEQLPAFAIIKLVSEPFQDETGLTAVGVRFDLKTNGKPVPVRITVMDPLNPRLTLHDADYVVSADGKVRIVCDFPDQVIPVGASLTVDVTLPYPFTATDLALEQYEITKAQALPEALAHRKFILHSVYQPCSEARPWNVWNNVGDDEKYLSAPADTGDKLQDRLRPYVRDIVLTLNQCRTLDPENKDPIVRQYYEWMYGRILRKQGKWPAYPTKFDSIEGVPEWASLAHQAWMQARQVPRWWIDNRLTPNGELGGEVGDDTDMFGNWSMFPMFERDGVGGMVLDAGGRLAEYADQTRLEDGINKRSMDPLHAYEEGMNQEALMALWFYGDPLYLERCMTAARSTEKLTMITEKGHRHFRANELGIDTARKPNAPDREHGTHALMWHPTLMSAWYNRNPTAVQWLTEWADGWLAHMKRGEEGTEVKLPDDTTTRTDPAPFAGGWGMTGSVFMFIADITGDAHFIKPYVDFIERTNRSTGEHLPELLQMGWLTESDKTSIAIKSRWPAALYTTGDKTPLIAALRRDIEELQRFEYMYTAVECFTDRVFLYAAINPSIAYTGGYTTRNKLNPTYAVSWNGFGTDYAALVIASQPYHLKVLLCNLSDKPISGDGTLWRLMPGEYEMTVGPDANNDDQVDKPERQENVDVTRGTVIHLTLPPQTVQVLELTARTRLKQRFDLPDLAIAAREFKVENGMLSGVVHNLGGGEVKNVVVGVIDATGKIVARKDLGPLAAPLDLTPKRLPFTFDHVEPGATVVVDPDEAVLEFNKGNNKAVVPTSAQ